MDQQWNSSTNKTVQLQPTIQQPNATEEWPQLGDETMKNNEKKRPNQYLNYKLRLLKQLKYVVVDLIVNSWWFHYVSPSESAA